MREYGGEVKMPSCWGRWWPIARGRNSRPDWGPRLRVGRQSGFDLRVGFGGDRNAIAKRLSSASLELRSSETVMLFPRRPIA
jgi:hypothetical protein